MIEEPKMPPSDGQTKMRFIDGVLELSRHDVLRNQYIVRHDAIVNGVHRTIAAEPIFGMCRDLEPELRTRREAALERFRFEERAMPAHDKKVEDFRELNRLLDAVHSMPADEAMADLLAQDYRATGVAWVRVDANGSVERIAPSTWSWK